jgi:hypothetical protein
MEAFKNCFVISICLFLIGSFIGCSKTHTTSNPDDPCWNLFASDSNYRKGKWVEIQSVNGAVLRPADTLWFIHDSLMAWTEYGYQGYLYTKMYFGHCNLFICQSWDSAEQAHGVWYDRNEYLDYNKGIVYIAFRDNLSAPS